MKASERAINVLSILTIIFAILGMIGLWIGILYINYHVIWDDPFSPLEKYQKILIYVGEGAGFIGCLVTCILISKKIHADKIEASVGYFFYGLLLIIFCGGLAGILVWTGMIVDGVSKIVSKNPRGNRDLNLNTNKVDHDEDKPKKKKLSGPVEDDFDGDAKTVDDPISINDIRDKIRSLKGKR